MTHDLRLVVLTFFPALGAIALMVLRGDDHAWIKRMALIIDDATITHVFYPVFPPDRNAGDVLEWLKANQV